jgi:hypothetical protein
MVDRHSQPRVFRGQEGVPDEITSLMNKNKMEAVVAWFNEREDVTTTGMLEAEEDCIEANSMFVSPGLNKAEGEHGGTHSREEQPLQENIPKRSSCSRVRFSWAKLRSLRPPDYDDRPYKVSDMAIDSLLSVRERIAYPSVSDHID